MSNLGSAIDHWVAIRKLSASDRTLKNYGEYRRWLIQFFGNKSLQEITAQDIHDYQHWRVGEIKKSHRARHTDKRWCGASRVNHEVALLRAVLRNEGRWDESLARCFAIPKPPTSPGVAFTPEEMDDIHRIASSRPKWLVAYCCWVISINTTAGPGEIRHLRLGDINLHSSPPRIHIREGLKNSNRQRVLPLNQEALEAVQTLVYRAERLGATRGDQCLLPGRRRHGRGIGWNLYTPQQDWKTAFYAMRREVAKRHPNLREMRMYDARHTAITSLLEAGVPEQTVIDLAGHVGRDMLKTYSHIRLAAKNDAVNVIARKAAA